MSTAINGIGDAFALHGFVSDGRHDVQYYRFKDFNQHFDDDAKSRLAGCKVGYQLTWVRSCAMQVSICLNNLSVVICSCWLPMESRWISVSGFRSTCSMIHKKAVEELYTKGILTYCLTLCPNANNYVKRIFSANNDTIIDNVQRLL